jgi:hypothetical protein
MSVGKPQIVVSYPPPPPPSQSLLPVPDGRAQGSYNVGGILVIPGSANGVARPTPYQVPAGMYVRVRGHNGASAGNVGNCYVARTREDALNGLSDTIEPNTEIIFPVDNLIAIWVRSVNAGDGVTISIRSS